jgi:hypothetical protein
MFIELSSGYGSLFKKKPFLASPKGSVKDQSAS